MGETIYLTQKIRDILVSMCFGDKEKIALFLGDRISKDEVYVINTTGAFEGEESRASLSNIFHVSDTLGAIINANRTFREKFRKEYTGDKYLLFMAHSHPRVVGQIVDYSCIAWSVDDIPTKYETSRGKLIQVKDLGGNLVTFSLKQKSDGKGGDDIFVEMVANQWRLIEYHFFIHPPQHLVGKPMTNEVAIDCFKYDPQMRLGKIRRIPIAQKALTQNDLVKTLLDPQKPIVVVEEGTGNLVLPYRR